MRPYWLAVAAILTLAIGSGAAAAQSGDVIVDNRTDQVVTMELNSWVGAGGSDVARTATYQFQPGERARLFHSKSPIRGSAIRYRLVTAAGSTPTDRTKVWINRYSTATKQIDVVINDSSLPSRKETRKSVRRAWAHIESNTELILGIAHPTAQFRRLEHEGTFGVRNRKDHFALTYKYHWRSALFDDLNWTRVDFYFDQRGRLYDMRAAQDSPGATSSFMDPFGFSNAVVDLLEDEILSAEEVQNDPVLREALKAAAGANDARLLLTLWLQATQP